MKQHTKPNKLSDKDKPGHKQLFKDSPAAFEIVSKTIPTFVVLLSFRTGRCGS